MTCGVKRDCARGGARRISEVQRALRAERSEATRGGGEETEADRSAYIVIH
jgi:hypothetical protein